MDYAHNLIQGRPEVCMWVDRRAGGWAGGGGGGRGAGGGGGR